MFSNAKEFKQYLKEAKSYDQDRLLSAQRSIRLAWGIAFISALLAGSSVLAVSALTPLKTVEPFVIRIDKATGIPEVMTSLIDGKETYDDAVARYFLATYVRTREGYSHAARDSIFDTVMLFTDGKEREEFQEYFNGSNPDSPQHRYGINRKAEIEIKSISFLDDDLAQVRYYKVEKDVHRSEAARSSWVSTINYDFDNTAKISSQDRLVNPLGFLVPDYKTDPEAIND